MSTETDTPAEIVVTDDLDQFSSEFFGQNTDAEGTTKPEETQTDVVEEVTTDTDAPKDEVPPEDDALTETDEDEPEDKEPEVVKPKSRSEKRIEELNAKFRETERRLNEALAKLEKAPEPTPVAKVVEDTGPQPDSLDANGNEVYPLGEFDPQYIRDLTRYTIKQEREAQKAEEAQETQTKAADIARQELQASWTQKLGPAQERYPDFVEKGEQLLDTFTGIDASYGEYLQATLMSMEFGTDVLYHLSTNPEEAQKIVNSGAAKATVALGRLEAKFADAAAEKVLAKPRVSSAPTPPPTNKGSAPVTAVTPDTDDLDAFAKQFFKKASG